MPWPIPLGTLRVWPYLFTDPNSPGLFL